MSKMLGEVLKFLKSLENDLKLLVIIICAVMLCVWKDNDVGLYVCLGMFFVSVSYIIYRRNLINRKNTFNNSEEWFERIISLLKDSTSAQIYLRSFVHPDDFRPKHKDSLDKIMNLFVDQMVRYPENFKIIGFIDERKQNNPIDWIQKEIKRRYPNRKANEIINNSITIIRQQPQPNSSTIYLIDGNKLLYNYVDSFLGTSYYYWQFDNCILAYLISKGFCEFFLKEQ